MRKSDRRNQSRAAGLALIWAASAAAPAAWGTTFTWIGSAGSWGDAAQWTGTGTIPPNSYAGSNASPEVFLGNNGSVNLGGGSWSIAYAHIGHSGANSPGTGWLNIDSGSITLTQNTYIGDGSAGTLIINGGQYITSASKNFFLGGGTVGTGTAYLEIDAGGTLTLNNRTGILPWTTTPGMSTINMSGGLIDFVANDNMDAILATKFIFTGGTITNIANTTINELSGSGSISVRTNSANPGVTVDQSIDTVFNGQIFGTSSGGKFTKLGSGVLELGPSGSISLTNLMTINGGTLRLGSNQSLPGGSGPPTISIGANGVLDLNGFAYTFKNFTGTGEVKLGSGGTLTLNTTGAVSYDGPITGNGGLVKISSTSTISNGTLALVSSGTNNLSKSSSIILGSSSTGLDVSGVAGGFTLADSVSQTLSVRGTVTGNVNAPTATTVTGNGTLSNNLTMSGGTIAPGNAGVGTIHLNGSLALNGAKLNIDVGATNADKIIVSRADGLSLSGNSVVTLNATGSINAGTYTIIDYSGAPLSDMGHLSLASPTLNGFNVALLYNSLDPTSIDLSITANVVGSTWNFNGDGNASDSTKWDGAVPNGIDQPANFTSHGGTITVSPTVTLDTDVTLGAINFDHTAGSYTIAGGGTSSLILDVTTGQAIVNVMSGNHTISAPVVLNKDTTVNATGSISFTGAVSATGKAITKTGPGAAQFENVRAGSLTVSGGALRISANGSPDSAAGTSVVNAFSVTSGSIDLTNNAMVVNYSSLGTLPSDVRSDLRSGQLATSLAAGGHALAYADNATLGRSTFAGQNVGSTSFLIGYTFAGDANLDGKVNALDFNALATNFGQSNGSQVWINGDFDYNGNVNTNDFTMLAQNFNSALPLGALSSSPFVSLGALVPEPSAVGLVATGMGLLTRRRRT
jgi:hypothetical protein